MKVLYDESDCGRKTQKVLVNSKLVFNVRLQIRLKNPFTHRKKLRDGAEDSQEDLDDGIVQAWCM